MTRRDYTSWSRCLVSPRYFGNHEGSRLKLCSPLKFNVELRVFAPASPRLWWKGTTLTLVKHSRTAWRPTACRASASLSSIMTPSNGHRGSASSNWDVSDLAAMAVKGAVKGLLLPSRLHHIVGSSAPIAPIGQAPIELIKPTLSCRS